MMLDILMQLVCLFAIFEKHFNPVDTKAAMITTISIPNKKKKYKFNM